jgi:glycosyltransferase involved in cell wall biosynthesis
VLETAEPGVISPVAAADHRPCRVAVIWIDWYAYHVARFAGLAAHPYLEGGVVGIELVGGIGVHAGLRFREELPTELWIETLFPETNWQDVGQARIAARLLQRLHALNPEVVLVPGYYTLPSLAAAAWARLHGRKSVLMTESTRADHQRSGWKEAAKGLLIRTLFNWAIAGGSPHTAYLRALGFPADRIAGFYDVVDNDRLYHEAERLRRAAIKGEPERPIASTGPYFLYVGRLAAEKNLGGLIEAYIAYRAGGGSWPLVLVGDGPERTRLEQMASRSVWADDIHFAGHASSRELPRFYAFAGCFVLPSTREPWGLVVNEAMATGLPVLVSARCGCAEDLVAGHGNGLIFDPAVEGALAASLAAIAKLPEEQRTRMSTQSLARIRRYSPARFGEEVAKIASALQLHPDHETPER